MARRSDEWKRGTDGKYWPAGYCDGDNGLPGEGNGNTLLPGGKDDPRATGAGDDRKEPTR
jgi:hypothetical protein